MNELPVLSVSEFVAIFNQTIEYAYPSVTIVGELTNFRISKNKWMYFDLKDEESSIHFFGSVFQLPGPLTDGLLMRVRAIPHLHPQYGFSLTVQHIELSGEGSIKQAADLLKAKLTAEGLFDPARKRSIIYPPARIGLITSAEAAAYIDFIKVISERWGGLEIVLADVLVQGESAEAQIIAAIDSFGQTTNPPDVLVITRGGGSADDLQVFNTEAITRAVAASRIPTVVAIGHERDISLAELAADQRASTPSNAAELLVPDKTQIIQGLHVTQQSMGSLLNHLLESSHQQLQNYQNNLALHLTTILKRASDGLVLKAKMLELLDPRTILKRGYTIIYMSGKVVKSALELPNGSEIIVSFHDGSIVAKVHN
jgi:exodeoxyribonuclease VII large subunit